MPPKSKLPDAEIAAIKEWVRLGAPWPVAAAAAAPAPAGIRGFTPEEKAFWAFQPVRRPAVPKCDDAGSAVANPIDAFLLAKLRGAGLAFAPPADKRTLIRRITFDLTGLPPTPAEVDTFLADNSPTAYEALVDRLLASPAYGEKWGRRWLDVARYADSNGMDENLAYVNAWRYRDWVIRSFNADKPYDEFVREQIAGDLIPGGTDAERADRLTATGFLVIGPKMLAEDDPVKMRMDIIDEQLDTLGQAFLGLTLGCARCHDHKFDPIAAADYYGLAGIFYSTKTMKNHSVVAAWNERPIGTPAAQAEHEKSLAAAKAAVAAAEQRAKTDVEASAMAARADELKRLRERNGRREGPTRGGRGDGRRRRGGREPAHPSSRQPSDARRGSPAAVPAHPRRRRPARGRRRPERPPGAGELADVPRSPAHGPGHGQPTLGRAFRGRLGAVPGQLRPARGPAHPPRVARLAGGGIRPREVVRQAPAPADRHLDGVPDELPARPAGGSR